MFSPLFNPITIGFAAIMIVTSFFVNPEEHEKVNQVKLEEAINKIQKKEIEEPITQHRNLLGFVAPNIKL